MQQGDAGSLLILALPVLLLVFMVMTQRRRQRQVQMVQGALQVGDEVVTTSGLFGRIIALDERVVTLDVGSGMTLRFDRRAIAGPAGPSSDTPSGGAPGAAGDGLAPDAPRDGS